MLHIGKVLIISGIIMLTMGCYIVFFSDKVKWFGNLPLDFSYKSNSAQFYAPIGSMTLLIAILSIIPKFRKTKVYLIQKNEWGILNDKFASSSIR